MLRPLSGSGFGIVLLPRKAGAFPLVKDIIDEVLAEGSVNLRCLGFMRAGLSCDILPIVRFSVDS